MFSMNEKDFDELIGVVENIKGLVMKAKDLNYDCKYGYVLDFLDCKVGNLLNNMKYAKLDLTSSRKIKSARFIVEDEDGEVIGSADTYEEAETMGGAKIIDGEKIQSGRIVSSVEKAVSEAEDYFGTIASDDTVSSQDVITRKDSLEMKKIADRNGVKVKIGRFSVSFHDDDFGKFSDMIHRD